MSLRSKKLPKPDYVLLGVVLALVLAGLIVIYSASVVESWENFGNTSYYFVHQLGYGAAIGLLAMYLFSRIDYHVWKKFIPLALLASVVLLLLVKVSQFGFAAGGATRWLQFGPILFQPSEIAKLALVFYLAGWMSQRFHRARGFNHDVLPALLILGLLAVLIIW